MRLALVILVALVAACGGSDGTSNQVGPPLKPEAQGLLLAVVQVGDGLQDSLPTLLVPSLAAARGIVFVPGAAPNSFTFHIPVDGDGDGTPEATLDGTTTLNGNLFSFGPGFGGTIDVTLAIAGGRTLVATLVFSLGAGGALQISGSGTLTDPATGTTVDFDIDPLNPLVIMVASGTATSAANLCDYNASGAVRIEAHGNSETYTALWTLLADRKPIAVTEATHTDAQGTETPQPDSSFVVGPCGSGTIQDWIGTYDFDWFCNPQEEGDSVMIVTVTGPNTIHIDDDGLGYDATAVPGNPHVVQGFFVDQGYREDFVWTLSRDVRTFQQQSVYVFQPPATGGGVCGGIGTKRP